MNKEDLPNLIFFANYKGDWNLYLEALYNFFKQDFVEKKPVFQGIKLGLKRYPLTKEKEATFWHFISEGLFELERLPDFRRCERIRWPYPIINNADGKSIKIWQEERNSEIRIHLYFEEVAYLVVLAKRKKYILPWTAYPVEQAHQRKKLLKRWEEFNRKAGHAF